MAFQKNRKQGSAIPVRSERFIVNCGSAVKSFLDDVVGVTKAGLEDSRPTDMSGVTFSGTRCVSPSIGVAEAEDVFQGAPIMVNA